MLKIQKIETRKDNIKQPELAELNHIPRINTSTILSGRSGSGKSLLLVNLLTRKEMLGDAFDAIYLISPTGESDDIQKKLALPAEQVFTDVMEGIDFIEKVLNANRTIIEQKGADKAPKLCVVYDDCIADKKLLNHPMFIKSFIACRHYNASTFICTQSYTAVPRRCRLQCSNIILFGCSQDELSILADTYTPARYTKKEFMELASFAMKEKFSFLYINMNADANHRYRKTFESILNLTK